MTTAQANTQRMAQALWTLIEPQPQEVKGYLIKLITQSMAKAEQQSQSEMSKAEVLAHIEQSCKEVRLIREGKLKAITEEELMDVL